MGKSDIMHGICGA
jgi:hypothetical protein